MAALPEATPSTREDLLFRGMTALQEDLGPALERLVVRVEALAARSPGDSGAWSQPEGEAWYAWRLRDVTTLPLTPQALHWLAQGEVARLHLALGEVRDQLDDLDHPTDPADLADLFQLLRTDPPLPAPEAARPAELEARLRGALAQVVSAPSDDLSATPADDTPRYALLAHLARQGAPGAALREAAVRGNETLPAFRRHLDVPAWSAGWDLYAAGLPRDLGLAEDPLVAAGVLTEELWAVGLLVVDTGLHHERWTLEQARDWLRANTPAEGARLEAALLEVLVRPGAAAAAPIGCLHLRELRTETEGRLGSRFDPVAFHDLVLDLGPVTLGMLEQHVRAWEGAR